MIEALLQFWINQAAKTLFMLLVVAGAASAETRIERKLFQLGGPETRTRCINELKTKGLPACRVENWNLTCDDTWIITCSEWATDFQQHEFFLVVTGPDVADALKQTLTTAVERSFVAAIAAAAATPGEVTIKTAAAITAFKLTFATELAVEPLLAAVKDQYQLGLQQKEFW